MTAAALQTVLRWPAARRRGAAAVALGVLAAHAALLLGGDRPAPSPERGAARQSPRPMQVRHLGKAKDLAAARAPDRVATPTSAQATTAEAARAALPAPPARRAARPGAAIAAATPSAAPARPRAAPRADATGPAELEREAPGAAAADAADAAAAAAAAAADDAGAGAAAGIAIPVYATRLPPAATLHYALQRGGASGQAELRWEPAEGRYALTLSGPAFATQRAWVSRGRIDAHGIAPERYAEARRGRELRAANFQRDSGRVTFSGPTHAYALVPGAQDRLSWMLQLAAIVAADPALQTAGARVTMWVAGARGAADAWEFEAAAQETVDVPGTAAAPALRWRREAVHAWDTEVDVWLDPQRHHLPVRARLRVPGSGATTEFTMLGMTAP